MPFTPIQPRRLYQEIADQIERLVGDGTFTAGERLPPERELAASLHVSRPTLREALIALELAGFIRIRKGAGIFVTESHPATHATELDIGPGPFELIEARLAFEGETAALAAERISDAELDALEAANATLEARTAHGLPGEEADWHFHQLIARATNNSAVISTVADLWSYRTRMPMWRRLHSVIREIEARPDWSDDRRAALDHRAIVAALRTRDPARSRAAMRDHLERVRKVLLTASDLNVIEFEPGHRHTGTTP